MYQMLRKIKKHNLYGRSEKTQGFNPGMNQANGLLVV